MAETMQDPNLPAGAIVEEFEDGGALRNDGVELRPANENPWYVLATVYGEQDGEQVDMNLHLKNMRIWNGFFGRKISARTRERMAEINNHAESDWTPLTVEERSLVRKALEQRGSEFPDNAGIVTFESLYFSRPVQMVGFIVPLGMRIDRCCFGQIFNINDTCFGGRFTTNNSHFAYEFEANVALFENSIVTTKSSFGGGTSFERTQCEGSVLFLGCAFEHGADFLGGTFGSKTSFLQTRFHDLVPTFYQRKMHQDTSFTLKPDHWPDVTDENAKDSKDAYTRLRVIMNDLQRPDDEHFFFRQEMRCKAVMEGGLDRLFIKAYGLVSDYGFSAVRPAAFLAGTVALGWAFMGSYFKYATDTAHPIAEGLGLSIANTFPFLGFIRRFHSDVFKSSPNWLDVIAGTQSILGIIFLFFFLLGLRNRFRLK